MPTPLRQLFAPGMYRVRAATGGFGVTWPPHGHRRSTPWMPAPDPQAALCAAFIHILTPGTTGTQGIVTGHELEAEFVRLTEIGELYKIQRMLRARRDRVPREVVREIVQEAFLRW